MKANVQKCPIGHFFTTVYSVFKLYFKSTDREEIAERQANQWFALMHSDARTMRDSENFKDWLNADVEHRIQYSQLEEFWTLIEKYTNRPEIRLAREKAYQRLSL